MGRRRIEMMARRCCLGISVSLVMLAFCSPMGVQNRGAASQWGRDLGLLVWPASVLLCEGLSASWACLTRSALRREMNVAKNKHSGIATCERCKTRCG